jgi:hypothetical protein
MGRRSDARLHRGILEPRATRLRVAAEQAEGTLMRQTTPPVAEKIAPLSPATVDVGRSERLRDTFELLSPGDLGALIGVDERTLAGWRAEKRGPDYARLGRAIFYRRPDVLAWIELNVMQTDRVN